jgi:hypothetical protein
MTTVIKRCEATTRDKERVKMDEWMDTHPKKNERKTTTEGPRDRGEGGSGVPTSLEMSKESFYQACGMCGRVRGARGGGDEGGRGRSEGGLWVNR